MTHDVGPGAHHQDTPAKVFDNPVVRKARVRVYDKICFGLGTLAALWLAILLITTETSLGWASILAVVLVWLVLAYLALPRLNRMLTAIYVPDYFIGRTRTSDGLLGDPLNLAVRGTGEQLATAMHKAGWIQADPVTLGTSIRIVKSTLTRKSYPKAPVSPLFLFDRSQDAAYQQEVEGNPAQRHHVRFWRTPSGWPLPGGARVDWLAAGTYDRRVGLSLFTLQITHKIDANIDVERDYIVESVTQAEPAVSVELLHDFTTSYHSHNGGGDSVHTDGNLPVLDVRAVQPAADAPDLQPVPLPGMPLQIWLPALINLLVAPFVVWTTLRSWPEGDDHTLAAITVVGSVVVAVMALSMFARNARARRILLAISALAAVAHLNGLAVADSPGLEVGHTLGAEVAILLLVALSSQKATDWTTR